MRISGRLTIGAASVVAGMLCAWAALRVMPMTAPLEQVAFAPAPAQPEGAATLWVLAVGVSRYADPRLNLAYAEDDARAVAQVLKDQEGGPLYSATRTKVLTNEEVTRESVLRTLDGFLEQAAVNDVVTIFMAGHGVQDRVTRSYYFLPHAANTSNLVTAGLRMSDFDDMVRAVRRNVQAVVLMLDTCHAGALSGGQDVAAEELVGRLSAGEGFYLLAATKPGEESREQPELRHGAFTYALLEGLRGAGDADHDGLLSLSDLFGYVARRVPLLTNGLQHPYHKMEGTDLTYVSVSGAVVSVEPPTPMLSSEAVTPVEAKNTTSNTIGVLQFTNLRGDERDEWIGKALRIAFNTELSKVRALRVYSPEVIDRTTQTRHTDSLTTAQHLGLNKLVTGAYQVVGTNLRIDAHILDVPTGVQQGSDSVEGEVDGFFDLQKQLVLSMLRRLPVPFSTEEGESIQSETNTDVNAYRLLLEAEGVVEEPAPGSPPTIKRAQKPTAEPQSYFRTEQQGLRTELARSGFREGEPPCEPVRGPALVHRGGSAGASPSQSVASALLALVTPAQAQAQEIVGDAEVRALVERYRQALESKAVERVAELSAGFSARQREALQAYFDNSAELVIETADIVVNTHEQQTTVSFIRRDRFNDRETGRPVRLEVRLTKTIVRENDTWKLAR